MTTIKIAAVGDILMWGRQIESAKLPNGKYSFDDMFKEVEPYLSNADLTIGNLETTFSGRELDYIQRHPQTLWPLFNCPDELAETLKRIGFDVLTTANNHCLDRGVTGIKRTLDILDQHQILHTGTFRSDTEFNNFLITNIKGISIGILSYTYGTNIILNLIDQPWLVNYMTNNLFSNISKLRKQVDCLIVCLHFGKEFDRNPSVKQKEWVKRCFEYGADVVLGAHPHVIQPMALEQVEDREGINKKRFVIYSLGNFVSDRMGNYFPNQKGHFIPDRIHNIHNDSGVILHLNITKNEQGETHITEISYVPTWVHLENNGRMRFRVLPIQIPSKYNLSANDIKIMKQVWQNTTSHLKGKVES
ncbi:CapA family protein [Peribacillus frigoritolerans]|uniref:CapA family protein n=1 Tax=Peribacillus frigoritolerans TaxID=450367 RepID=UPI002B0577AA|nr:CapA family protein [Peribacillus frigoritolerans]MEA3577712.1 CapA family protein [Peribacillus frigoritolerans]